VLENHMLPASILPNGPFWSSTTVEMLTSVVLSTTLPLVQPHRNYCPRGNRGTDETLPLFPSPSDEKTYRQVKVFRQPAGMRFAYRALTEHDVRRHATRPEH
jgi:hypothetical protein